MKRAVLIGAGQTGRGFLAPIVLQNGYEITFIDRDAALIERLRAEGAYTVRYFGDKKVPVTVSGFTALAIGRDDAEDDRAIEALARADLVFISVMANHIGALAEPLNRAAAERKRLQAQGDAPEGKLSVICCENGINVKRPLIEAGVDAVISEGAVFCTTLRPDPERLELVSQADIVLPVDSSVEGLKLELQGCRPEPDFPSLIQRKIYTYNFISAIIAYLGSYAGYEVYAEAANDATIAAVIEGVVPIISRVISKEYHVTYEEQLAFTAMAVEKFQNREIYDTIYRNAREVGRKLGPKERILTPLRLAIQYQEPTGLIELVAAAAVHYGTVHEGLSAGDILPTLEALRGGEAPRLRKMLELMREGTPLEKIVESIER